MLLAISFVIGAVPLTGWLTLLLSGQNLAQLGTRNISVSAAFYHGGNRAGIVAVMVEAAKGIGAVGLARGLFPEVPAWQLIALCALVLGRYSLGKGAGVTNVVWGIIAYDWQVAMFIALIGGVGFTLVRERRIWRYSILALFPVVIDLHRHSRGETVIALLLALLIALIYQLLSDDLDLSPDQSNVQTKAVFKFFRTGYTVRSLHQSLDAKQVGKKAATLSQLKRWGYDVPSGWVLPPGDDAEPLIAFLDPSPAHPLIVRSSAMGEDTESASAAGQYLSQANVCSRIDLRQAIANCRAAYDLESASQYRQDRHIVPEGMAILVQEQIQGIFSGVAFSRDPITGGENAVAIEAMAGGAEQVVSGRITPECYQVHFSAATALDSPLEVQGPLEVVPLELVSRVARLTRDLEARYHGIPQDLEWTYDGQVLWVLQARPITTLLPIWTRRIASEVIPGVLHPLTWSLNQPLTCGVWGDLFTLVLAQRVEGLNFHDMATLHYSQAYFNASLLGQIFRRMGLPPESLEFLTRGASMSRPALSVMLRNTPGLWRLAQREWRLPQDFARDSSQWFEPLLQRLSQSQLDTFSPEDLLDQIDQILTGLRRATYYSILAPLSVALRQAILKVADEELDTQALPEMQSLRSLQELALASRHLFDDWHEMATVSSADLFTALSESPDGQSVLEQFDQFLGQYGYLSEVATDISVPTWQEDPRVVRQRFTQMLLHPLPPSPAAPPSVRWQQKNVQNRLDLKGRVAELYNRLLAELRWHILALEQRWLSATTLNQPGDIFFLKFSEIRALNEDTTPDLISSLAQTLDQRRSQLQADQQRSSIPMVVYGAPIPSTHLLTERFLTASQLHGIGASPGQVEGQVKVVRSLQALPHQLSTNTILVVPYTDAGWGPLLASAGGIIAEVGGRLSHGAIIAREYGIPAVMDLSHATEYLKDGQRVRLDGSNGLVELL